MTWNAHRGAGRTSGHTVARSRGKVLRDVSAAADVRRDGLLPLDIDGSASVFRDELDLLGALQLRWHTRLAGRIDRALASQPVDLERAVVAAWRVTAEELPGLRAVLDRHREHPLDDAMAHAMTVATRKELSWLAVMAGRAGLSDDSAHLGAAIEERARAGVQPHRTPGARAAPTLIGRLRAALAAA